MWFSSESEIILLGLYNFTWTIHTLRDVLLNNENPTSSGHKKDPCRISDSLSDAQKDLKKCNLWKRSSKNIGCTRNRLC